MKIGELNDRCGECPLIDLCGEPYSDVHICAREALKNMTTNEYEKIVKKIRENSKKNWSNATLENKVIASLN